MTPEHADVWELPPNDQGRLIFMRQMISSRIHENHMLYHALFMQATSGSAFPESQCDYARKQWQEFTGAGKKTEKVLTKPSSGAETPVHPPEPSKAPWRSLRFDQMPPTPAQREENERLNHVKTSVRRRGPTVRQVLRRMLRRGERI